jgi:anti-anti-sigma factor
VTLADVQFSDRGQALIAHMTGEIDLSNADQIGAAIALEMSNSSLALVFDLSDMDYLDSAGIRLIYQLRESLRARGQSLRLIIPAASPANDALRLAGVLQHIETVETLDDALHEVS